jgi:hypothetical protein
VFSELADLQFAAPYKECLQVKGGSTHSRSEALFGSFGLEVGGPEEVDVVDGVLRLWFTLVVKKEPGRRLAVKMVRET